MTPREMAKHLKKQMPKSYKRYVNLRILEHIDNRVPKCLLHHTKEYWEEVKQILEL